MSVHCNSRLAAPRQFSGAGRPSCVSDEWWIMLQWAKAIADWTRDDDGFFVDCLKTFEKEGATAGDPIRVHIPCTGGYEPTVFAGDVIPYAVDGSGDAIGMGTLSDVPVGAVRMFAAGATVPTNWKVVADDPLTLGFDSAVTIRRIR